MWTNTHQALSHLSDLLHCSICNKVVSSPCTLGSCEHFFCRSCVVEDVIGNQCPVCGLPSHVKDVQDNKQLATAVSLCRQLEKLLARDEKLANQETKENQNTEVKSNQFLSPPSRTTDPAQDPDPVALLASVYDFGASQTTATPVSRRTRKRQKKQRKQQAVANSNKMWGFVSDQPCGHPSVMEEKCTSCQKKNGGKRRSVLFDMPKLDLVSEENDGDNGDEDGVTISERLNDLLDEAANDDVQTDSVPDNPRVPGNDTDSSATLNKDTSSVLDKSSSLPSSKPEAMSSRNKSSRNKKVKSKGNLGENTTDAARMFDDQETGDFKEKETKVTESVKSEPHVNGKRRGRRRLVHVESSSGDWGKTESSVIEEVVNKKDAGTKSAVSEVGKDLLDCITDGESGVAESGVSNSKSSPCGKSTDTASTDRTMSRSNLENASPSRRVLKAKRGRSKSSGALGEKPPDGSNSTDSAAETDSLTKHQPATPTTKSVNAATDTTPVSRRKKGRDSGTALSSNTSASEANYAEISRTPPASENKKGRKSITTPVNQKKCVSNIGASPANQTEMGGTPPVNQKRRGRRSNVTPVSQIKMAGSSDTKHQANGALPVTPVSQRKKAANKFSTPVNQVRRAGHPSRSPGSVTESPGWLTKKNSKGETPLHVAAIKGDTDRVRELLEQGATPNVKDNAGWTPLHEACNHGRVEIAELLTKHGAFINIPGMDNDTPLHDAVQNYRLDCVRLLVSSGASVNVRNSQGKTPLDLAQNDVMREALQIPVEEDKVSTVSSQQVPASIAVHQVVLLTTGFKREEQKLVQQLASLLHGKTVQEFSDEVTHVVTTVNSDGMCPRTIKYLQAVLSGKWVVNKEWVELCLEYGSRVCEDAFEVPGTSANPNSYASNKARINREKQLPALFDGCHIFFQGDFSYPTPEKKDLINLVKLGGATLLSREPRMETLDQSQLTVPYHAMQGSSLANCSHYIIHDRKKEKVRLVGGRLCIAPASWIMESIANFTLIEPDLV